MNVIEFTKKSMGSEIPTLTDFKLIETSKSGCMITCQVDYSGDAYFEAEIGASFGKITIGIKDISFKGPLMIELKDLCGKVPFISALIAYFTKPPKVNFEMTGVAECINSPGLYSYVFCAILSPLFSRHIENDTAIDCRCNGVTFTGTQTDGHSNGMFRCIDIQIPNSKAFIVAQRYRSKEINEI